MVDIEDACPECGGKAVMPCNHDETDQLEYAPAYVEQLEDTILRISVRHNDCYEQVICECCGEVYNYRSYSDELPDYVERMKFADRIKHTDKCLYAKILAIRAERRANE